MPSKKKSAKSKHKPKRIARKKTAAVKRKAPRAKSAAKPKSAKKTAKKALKKTAKKKAAPEKTVLKSRSGRKIRTSVSAEREVRQEIRNRDLTTDTSFGRQSGDLQGLSRDEQADSESVDELVEEGNAFEADAVAGVEEADDSDEKEVHTHEVPEDDVPDEYLD